MDVQTRAFISRVLPWPTAGEPGVINLEWRRTWQGRQFWAGRPFVKVDDFINLSQWALQQSQIKDQYFCMSRQAKTGKIKNGKVYSARNSSDALALKAIWLDIDVKNDPKAYEDFKEAVLAFKKFLKETKYPFPTAIVRSGGGLHIYWISSKQMSKSQWAPYAEALKQAAVKHGLKCDAGLTTDAARLLRVPDTFNHKQEKIRPVKLLHLSADDLDFSKLPTAIPQVTGQVTLQELPEAFRGEKPAAAFAELDAVGDLLGGGYHNEPLDPRPIIRGCPFFKDAFATHGKDHTQPLWNLTVLATTFMAGGEGLVHKLSNAHPGYSAAETDAMFARKSREKDQKKLGWPGCSSFENEGSSFCKACPHRGKIKTPLHLAKQSSVPSHVEDIQLQDVLCLPSGYELHPFGDKNVICKMVTVDSKDASAESVPIPLFYSELSAVSATEPYSAINFTTTLSKGQFDQATLTINDIHNIAILKQKLALARVKYVPENAKYLEGFFMAWLNKLHAMQEAQLAQPFGWISTPDGTHQGFAYGGKIFKPNGGVMAASFIDKNVRPQYTPVGKRAVWFDCLELITKQKRPPLEVIVASSFASPLLFLAGVRGGTIGIWSGDSGTNKTAALHVAMGVWGCPGKIKMKGSGTTNSIGNLMGQLKAIPIFIDDIKDLDEQRLFFKNMWENQDGVEKSRMWGDGTQREKGTWQTCFVTTSNLSFYDFLADHQTSTDAGMARMLEFHIDQVPLDGIGKVTTIEADERIFKMDYNYGHVGLEYAKFLALNREAINTRRKEITTEFAHTVGQVRHKEGNKERIWVQLCGCLLTGALYANELFECGFDIPAMNTFLIEAYKGCREKTKTSGVGNSAMLSQSFLAGFIKAMEPRSIITNRSPTGAGNKNKDIVRVLCPPSVYVKGDGLAIQWITEESCLRISRKQLRAYITKENLNVTPIVNALVKEYKAEDDKVQLAGGTNYRCPQEPILHIPVPEGSELQLFMYSRVPREHVPPHIQAILAAE